MHFLGGGREMERGTQFGACLKERWHGNENGCLSDKVYFVLYAF